MTTECKFCHALCQHQAAVMCDRCYELARRITDVSVPILAKIIIEQFPGEGSRKALVRELLQ